MTLNIVLCTEFNEQCELNKTIIFKNNGHTWWVLLCKNNSINYKISKHVNYQNVVKAKYITQHLKNNILTNHFIIYVYITCDICHRHIHKERFKWPIQITDKIVLTLHHLYCRRWQLTDSINDSRQYIVTTKII